MVKVLMKKLKKGVKENFYKKEPGREKEVNAYYLFKDQIEQIDDISNGNPSKFLRNWIDQKVKDKDGISDKLREFARILAEFQLAIKEQVHENTEKVEGLEERIEELESSRSKLKESNDQEENKDLSIMVEGVQIRDSGGGPGCNEVREILHKSKIGNGIKVGDVEMKLDLNRKKTLKVMRKIADVYKPYKFREGKGNKGSMLYHSR